MEEELATRGRVDAGSFIVPALTVQ